jgi:hypothetical protein
MLREKTIFGIKIKISDDNKIIFEKDGKTTKPVEIPDTLEKCQKIGNILSEKLQWIQSGIIYNFAEELNNFINETKNVPKTKVPTTLAEILEGPEEEKKEITKKEEKPLPSTIPITISKSSLIDSILNKLTQREKQMLNVVAQKFSKDVNELVEFYYNESKRLRVPCGLLIYKDWKRIGGEPIRRMVLIDENLRMFKFFTSADNIFPINTCVKLVSNLKLPFTEGRIIGLSNRAISMFFSDYIEYVEGQIIKRKISEEPRIDSIIKIPETDEIYTRIPKAEDVLSPIDPEHSLSKILELTKQYQMPIEEIVLGTIDAIYRTASESRLAVHIGDSEVHPNRITAWVEASRFYLDENYYNKIVRCFGYIQYLASTYQEQIQDNLTINVYNLIVEE